MADFPTSYIPTTGTAATRAADIATITGANFSSWYNQSEGTAYADFRLIEMPPVSAPRSVLMINNAASNINTIDNHLTAGGVQFRARSASVNLALLSGINASDKPNKSAFAFGTTLYAGSANGLLSTAGGSAALPAPTFLEIGSANYAGLKPFCGTFSRLVYWRRRLPDLNLQELTR